MLKSGILNPQINSLLSRVRHTNTLVIADRGFPFWPPTTESPLETIDISLIDGIPTVLEVLKALAPNFVIGHAWMASEFCDHNPPALYEQYAQRLPSIVFEPHIDFKRRVPRAIGLIRTGDAAPYANLILESA